MELKNKQYRLIDFLKISLSIAPISAGLRVLDKVVFALAPSLQILATARFVDTVILIWHGEAARSQVILPLVWVTLLAGYLFTSQVLFGFAKSMMGIGLNKTFRPAVVKKRAALAYQHIENNETWDLISRVGEDPGAQVEEGFENILSFCGAVLNIGSVLLVIATQVWWAALVIMVISVPLFFVSIKSGKQTYNAFVDAQKHQRRATYLQGVLTNRDSVEERSFFKYSHKVNHHWHERFMASFQINMKVQKHAQIKQKIGSVFLVLTSLFIAGVLVVPLNAGAITIGIFIGMVNAVFLLVRTTGQEIPWIATGLAYSHKYMADLTTFSHFSETEGALDAPAAHMPAPDCIQFVNVSFAYPGTTTQILDNLNLTLRGGMHYAFVGANGAGKTTITKLLTGLYDNYTGDILIDGKNLRQFTQAQLKATFSVVYQDFARYQIPFKDSVGVSNTGATEADIRQAVDLVDLGGLADTLPQGMDTPLGKIRAGGADLSGGQWQRVAIARSVVSAAPFRILDEPTAALDPNAESAVYKMFGEISHGKSTVFITHRLGAAKLADEIFVIANGQVTEKGSHDALMEENGLYAEMFESQRGWYVDEAE